MSNVALYAILAGIFIGSLVFAFVVEGYQDRASRDIIEQIRKSRESLKQPGPIFPHDGVPPEKKKPFRKAAA